MSRAGNLACFDLLLVVLRHISALRFRVFVGHYFEHVRRIADKDNGIVLMITQKDLEIFIRQAINGKSNQGHIQELYDQTVREIS